MISKANAFCKATLACRASQRENRRTVTLASSLRLFPLYFAASSSAATLPAIAMALRVSQAG
jgi:hypothetical protein